MEIHPLFPRWMLQLISVTLGKLALASGKLYRCVNHVIPPEGSLLCLPSGEVTRDNPYEDVKLAPMCLPIARSQVPKVMENIPVIICYFRMNVSDDLCLTCDRERGRRTCVFWYSNNQCQEEITPQLLSSSCLLNPKPCKVTLAKWRRRASKYRQHPNPPPLQKPPSRLHPDAQAPRKHRGRLR